MAEQNYTHTKSDTHIRLSAPLQRDSVVDGPGLRTVIWTQGCAHNCPGCHNPQTHSFSGGSDIPIDTICDPINKWKQDVTFSGGDPMQQAKQCAKIARFAKSIGLNVWAYTGYTIETLLPQYGKNGYIRDFLNNIDRLVDGKFEIQNKSMECPFRGSTNQRIIDVPATLNRLECGNNDFVVIDPRYVCDPEV